MTKKYHIVVAGSKPRPHDFCEWLREQGHTAEIDRSIQSDCVNGKYAWKARWSSDLITKLYGQYLKSLPQ